MQFPASCWLLDELHQRGQQANVLRLEACLQSAGFSRSVDLVSATKILASAEDNHRQFVVYSMTVAANYGSRLS